MIRRITNESYPKPFYHRHIDLLSAVGLSGCMVAFMIVLVLPLFRSTIPSPSGNTGTIIQAHIFPPASAPVAPPTLSTGNAASPGPVTEQPAQPTPSPTAKPAGQASVPSTDTPASGAPHSTTTAHNPVASPSAGIASRAKQAAVRSATSAFQDALYDHIGQYEVYPPDALQRRLQGVVLTVFTMDRDGHVAKVWVKKTSGEMVLDEAATQSILRAEPLPAIPPQLPNHLTVELPIAFSPSDPQSSD